MNQAWIVSQVWVELLCAASCAGAQAEIVAEADLQATQQWMQQHLEETHPPVTSRSELQVWACQGGLLRNGRAGRPLRIGGQEYRRGLLAHAPSKIVVQLDSPGKSFSALVGLDSNDVPISFIYGETPSRWLLPTWQRHDELQSLDENRWQRTTTWTDARTALEVRCTSVEYRDFPAVEWTVHFQNRGTAETPILQNIRAVDIWAEESRRGEFRLRGCRGDNCTPGSFAPYVAALGPNECRVFAPPGGRPTEDVFPYFNLEMRDRGLILAVGWPGQWTASFARDSGSRVHVTGGQQQTRFKLLPGERARTPLVALLFWRGGDWIRAQNIWRRWMVKHNLPRPGGQPITTHYGSCWSATLNPNAAEELAIVDGFRREGIQLDYYFIDAGWYPNRGSWVNTGTWEVDRTRFPHGVREVADRVHQGGAKFVLWFEPERVAAGSWLADQHSEWILQSGGGRLLNLGHPEAWRWVVEKIDRLIIGEGVNALLWFGHGAG